MEDIWEEVWFNSKDERDNYIKKHNVYEDCIYLEHNRSACERREIDYELVKHEVGIVYNLTKNKKDEERKKSIFKQYKQRLEALNDEKIYRIRRS